MIKDFPELTFGAISIKNAFGRFHVVLDSVLVFKKVGLNPVVSHAGSLVQSYGKSKGFGYKLWLCYLCAKWYWTS